MHDKAEFYELSLYKYGWAFTAWGFEYQPML